MESTSTIHLLRRKRILLGSVWTQQQELIGPRMKRPRFTMDMYNTSQPWPCQRATLTALGQEMTICLSYWTFRGRNASDCPLMLHHSPLWCSSCPCLPNAYVFWRLDRLQSLSFLKKWSTPTKIIMWYKLLSSCSKTLLNLTFLCFPLPTSSRFPAVTAILTFSLHCRPLPRSQISSTSVFYPRIPAKIRAYWIETLPFRLLSVSRY